MREHSGVTLFAEIAALVAILAFSIFAVVWANVQLNRRRITARQAACAAFGLALLALLLTLLQYVGLVPWSEVTMFLNSGFFDRIVWPGLIHLLILASLLLGVRTWQSKIGKATVIFSLVQLLVFLRVDFSMYGLLVQ